MEGSVLDPPGPQEPCGVPQARNKLAEGERRCPRNLGNEWVGYSRLQRQEHCTRADEAATGWADTSETAAHTHVPGNEQLMERVWRAELGEEDDKRRRLECPPRRWRGAESRCAQMRLLCLCSVGRER